MSTIILDKTFFSLIYYLMIFVNCNVLEANTKHSPLRIQPLVIDIGICVIGENITVETTITNQGPDPVNVKKVVQSCSCLYVSPTSFMINPGKSVTLKMVISGPYREQQFSTKVWILTNDPHNPNYKIEIIGNFIASDHQLMANPPTCIIGTLPLGSKISRVIMVVRNGNIPIGDVKISTTKSWIKVAPQKDNEENLRLYITIDIPKKTGKIDEEILVQSLDEKEYVRVPVKGLVSPQIEISPQFVFVTPDKNDYRISVETYNNITPELLNYEFESDDFDLLSCRLNTKEAKQLIVMIKRQHLHTGFAKGKLLIRFAGEPEPFEITFISSNM